MSIEDDTNLQLTAGIAVGGGLLLALVSYAALKSRAPRPTPLGALHDGKTLIIERPRARVQQLRLPTQSRPYVQSRDLAWEGTRWPEDLDAPYVAPYVPAPRAGSRKIPTTRPTRGSRVARTLPG